MSGGSDYAGKPRPVVIVQDDRFNDVESVTFIAFTSNLMNSPLTRLNVEPSAINGLMKECQMMIDKVSTAPQTKLGKVIGNLSNEDVIRMNRALLVYLGLAG